MKGMWGEGQKEVAGPKHPKGGLRAWAPLHFPDPDLSEGVTPSRGGRSQLPKAQPTGAQHQFLPWVRSTETYVLGQWHFNLDFLSYY